MKMFGVVVQVLKHCFVTYKRRHGGRKAKIRKCHDLFREVRSVQTKKYQAHCNKINLKILWSCLSLQAFVHAGVNRKSVLVVSCSISVDPRSSHPVRLFISDHFRKEFSEVPQSTQSCCTTSNDTYTCCLAY